MHDPSGARLRGSAGDRGRGGRFRVPEHVVTMRISTRSCRAPAKRPIPAGKIRPSEALAFGMTLSSARSCSSGWWRTGWAAGAPGIHHLLFYAVIYSMWLNALDTAEHRSSAVRRGPSFPPMIGQAAVTGAVTLDTVILFAIHLHSGRRRNFWALALVNIGGLRPRRCSPSASQCAWPG